MASLDLITEELLGESGQSSPQAIHDISEKAKEIAMEMLMDGAGRFMQLRRTQSISIDTTNKQYILNADFYGHRPSFAQFDSNGDFVRTIFILTKSQIYQRIDNDQVIGSRLCYIEFLEDGRSGRGYYLVLSDEAGEACTYKFDYFRVPTEADISILDDVTTLKRGIRGSLPQYFANAPVDAKAYFVKLQKPIEDSSLVNPRVVISLNRRQQARNRLKDKIGGGG